MKIQSINFSLSRNKNISFLNNGRQNSQSESPYIGASSPVHYENDKYKRENLLVALSSIGIVNSDYSLNMYLKDSKQEAEHIQESAKNYYKECVKILFHSCFSKFSRPIKYKGYDVTFGEVNKNTHRPDLINLWQDGKLTRQYQINKTLPALNISVYNCDDENIEEYLINNKRAVNYTLTNPKNNNVKVFIYTARGFYKLEGEDVPEGEHIYKSIRLKKGKSITYNPNGHSFYTLYQGDEKTIFRSDETNTKWNKFFAK